MYPFNKFLFSTHCVLSIQGFPGGASGKEPACQCQLDVRDVREVDRSLSREHSLEKGLAIHSSILPWRISRTEEPGGLQSIGSHDCWTRLKRQHSTVC